MGEMDRIFIAYWKDGSVSAYHSDTDREIERNKIVRLKGEDWLEGHAEFTHEELEAPDRLFERKACEEIGLFIKLWDEA